MMRKRPNSESQPLKLHFNQLFFTLGFYCALNFDIFSLSIYGHMNWTFILSVKSHSIQTIFTKYYVPGLDKSKELTKFVLGSNQDRNKMLCSQWKIHKIRHDFVRYATHLIEWYSFYRPSNYEIRVFNTLNAAGIS